MKERIDNGRESDKAYKLEQGTKAAPCFYCARFYKSRQLPSDRLKC